MIFMQTESANNMAVHALDKLEVRLEELIQLCDRLRDDNEALRQQHTTLTAERNELLEKNELSRARIEAMVARLKALEP